MHIISVEKKRQYEFRFTCSCGGDRELLRHSHNGLSDWSHAQGIA